MPRIIPDDLVETVTRALLGSIDTGDGGTAEQRQVLQAIVSGYWERPDLVLDTLDPIGPADTARLVTDAAQRRRVREFAVLLEVCRHPIDDAQVTLTDSYAAAIGESGPGLDLVRDPVRRGMSQAMADRDRWMAEQVGPELRRRGLAFVGLDVIGDYLTEVNVTSPTCVQELDTQFGLNISAMLMDHIETQVQRNG